MSQNTNISIIQLIKAGAVSVEFEIANIKAQKDINVHVKSYLQKSDHYQDIQQLITETKDKIAHAERIEDKLHFDKKLRHLHEVEQDFVSNTLHLAKALSEIGPRTERLKKAIELFEQADIRGADAILNEADLLNDQFSLIAFVAYQRKKINSLEHDLHTLFNEDPELDRQ